jgi:hypothetical protein
MVEPPRAQASPATVWRAHAGGGADVTSGSMPPGRVDSTIPRSDRGWARPDDFRGPRRDRIDAQSEIRRPDGSEYHGGHEEEAEGYAPVHVPA